jgi:hypothetical protein
MPSEADRPVTIAPEPLAQTPAPSSPKPVSMTQPASSGFAPALESRANVTPSAAVPAGLVPAPAAVVKDSTLAPAPSDLQLDLPVLPGGDSLVVPPKSQGDSAMKRILRAVNGGKDLPPTR